MYQTKRKAVGLTDLKLALFAKAQVKQASLYTTEEGEGYGRAVQLTVFQLIINGNKFVTFNRTNRLITAVISDPLHSL